MEELLGMKLAGKVIFVDRQEQWIDFNGDGEKVVIFNVKDTNTLHRKVGEMTPYDQDWAGLAFANSLLAPILQHTAGYYMEKREGDMVQSLFYDTIGQRLVYRLSII